MSLPHLVEARSPLDVILERALIITLDLLLAVDYNSNRTPRRLFSSETTGNALNELPCDITRPSSAQGRRLF